MVDHPDRGKPERKLMINETGNNFLFTLRTSGYNKNYYSYDHRLYELRDS